jgi:hypothetical protein
MQTTIKGDRDQPRPMNEAEEEGFRGLPHRTHRDNPTIPDVFTCSRVGSRTEHVTAPLSRIWRPLPISWFHEQRDSYPGYLNLVRELPKI